MSTTFAARLIEDAQNLRLYFTVQGVPNVFQEGAVDLPSSMEIGRPRTKLVASISQGETRIDLARRRISGASLTIRLQEDDAGTLAALFKMRAHRKGFIAADAAKTDTTITPSSTSWATSTQVFYVGGETIQAGNISAGTFTGCTRGAFNSDAQKHFGASDNGRSIFDVPPSWVGRRIYLTGYFVNDDGSTTSLLASRLGTFTIATPPKMIGDDIWEISATELVTEYAEKKIGGGIIDVTPTTETIPVVVSNLIQVKVGAGQGFNQFNGPGGDSGNVFALIKKQSGHAQCWGLVGTTGTDTVVLDPSQRMINFVGFDGSPVKTIRLIGVLSSRSDVMARRLLTSRLGDGSNGSDDVLPGMDATVEGGDTWRMGAGVDVGDIDTASLSSVVADNSWDFVVDQEITVDDFMFEFCLQNGCYWGSNRSGQLFAKTLSEDGSASVMTIDDSIIDESTPPSIEYAEDEIFPRVHLECNYDVISGQSLATVNVFDSALQDRYPHREESLELKSKTIIVDSLPLGSVTGPAGVQIFTRRTTSLNALEEKLRHIQVRNGRGRVYVTLKCHMPVMQAQPGDVVKLSTTLIDLEGNKSLSLHSARVIAMNPGEYNGRIDVTLELLDQLFRVAPAAVIASLGTGNDLVLQTTGPETASTKPARMFTNGDNIECWSVSAGTFTAHSIINIVSDNEITLDSPLGFTLQAGVDFIRIGPQNTQNTAVTDDGFTGSDWLYQMPDDETTTSPVTRWR